MVQEFISKRGVSVLPGMGTPELRLLNVQREKAYAESGHYHWGASKKRRPKKTGAV